MSSNDSPGPNPAGETRDRSSATDRDPLELALTEFTNLRRRGQATSIDEFAARYPHLADQIRELFPLVDNLEHWKSEKEIECLRRSVPKEFPFDQLGDYRLIKELGRGGMGVVFQALHTTTQRPVAIKLLPWRYAADMGLWKDRLQREAATIAALKHPNIVQIYSFSHDHGYYYYVMQLVDGICLDKIIPQLKRQRGMRRSSRSFFPTPDLRKLSLTYDAWRRFAKIGEQVAAALDCAHQQKVLHNDIKPSNLMLRSTGQVIVTDFGIGGHHDDQPDSDDDRAVGTLRYMAPERWNGIFGPAGDIYSLGVTLYELVTQNPVFNSTKRSELAEVIQLQEPVKPRRIVSELPEPLERIILKAMSKPVQNRYLSARELADDLRRFGNRQPIQAAEQGVLDSAASWLANWTSRWRRPS